MATKKTEARPAKPLSGKEKRWLREKARRERQRRELMARSGGFKEKFLSLCSAAGVMGALVFLGIMTYACLYPSD